MKITLHFKTPDVCDNTCERVQENLLSQYLDDHDAASRTDLTTEQDGEMDDMLAQCQDEISAACAKYVTYGECCAIELDTVTMEARVLPANH